jgi:hypothetical protein
LDIHLGLEPIVEAERAQVKKRFERATIRERLNAGLARRRLKARSSAARATMMPSNELQLFGCAVKASA